MLPDPGTITRSFVKHHLRSFVGDLLDIIPPHLVLGIFIALVGVVINANVIFISILAYTCQDRLLQLAINTPVGTSAAGLNTSFFDDPVIGNSPGDNFFPQLDLSTQKREE